MKKVFGYLRVSGKGQLDGDGFDRQRAGIEEYCSRNNLSVLRYFSDGGVSGTVEAEDRAGYADMLLLAGDATATVIVVERADRLARDLMVSELCVEEARKRGLMIVEACSGCNLTDSSDPSRVAIRQMMAVFAQWNKTVMVMRLGSARRRKKDRGLCCEGQKPFDLKSEINAETAALIIGFREAGWAFHDIAKKLQAMGRPCAQHGKCWQAGSVHAIYKRLIARQEPQRKPRPSITDGLLD